MNTTNTTTTPHKPENKPKNQFAALPEADRKFILDLCSKTPYDEAVELLRRPRSEGGLNIITSRSALSRFCTSAQPESHHALLAQFAAAANIRHEQQSNAFLGAIRAAVQARVLENIRSGRALIDLQHDFKLLRIAETLYLADANFRAIHPKTARASYKDYVQHCAEAPDTDFLPADETPVDPNPLHDPTDLDRDIQKERERQQEILNILKKTGVEREHSDLPDHRTLAALTAALAPRPTRTTPSPIPPQNPPKTPAIPHFPPNPTKEKSSPANTPQPKPTPYIAPPKPGRNDPCPCGSNRKSKKCCHP
jgi:hypothetical protein